MVIEVTRSANLVLQEAYSPSWDICTIRNCMTLVVAIVVSVSGHPVKAAELSDIQTALTQYYSSILSLEGTYSIRYYGGKHKADAVVMENLTQEMEFAYDVSNDRLAVDERATWMFSRISTEIPFRSRTTRAYDGVESYALRYTPVAGPIPSQLPAERPLALMIHGNNTLDTSLAPWHLAGVRTRVWFVNLSTLLRQPEVQVVGRESINGTSCIHVSVTRDGLRYSVWLDPEHDFLPWRQEYRKAESGRSSRLVSGEYVFQTTEFGQFPDQLHNARRWFPTKGNVDLWIGSREISVIGLKLNSQLEPVKFRIDPATLPEGVAVHPASGKSWITGDNRGLYEELNKLYDERTAQIDALLGTSGASERPLAAAAPVRARPRDNRWAWLALGAVSLTALILGAWRMAATRS